MNVIYVLLLLIRVDNESFAAVSAFQRYHGCERAHIQINVHYVFVCAAYRLRVDANVCLRFARDVFT